MPVTAPGLWRWRVVMRMVLLFSGPAWPAPPRPGVEVRRGADDAVGIVGRLVDEHREGRARLERVGAGEVVGAAPVGHQRVADVVYE